TGQRAHQVGHEDGGALLRLLAPGQLHDPDDQLHQRQQGHHGHADEVPVLRRLIAVRGPAAPGGQQQRGDAGHQRQDIKHGSDLITPENPRRARPRPGAPRGPGRGPAAGDGRGSPFEVAAPRTRKVDGMTIHAQALLFDNDGTLVSTLESVRRCWTRWAAEYGITAERFGAVELHGRTAAEIAADLLPADVVPEAVARIEDLEVEDVPHGGVRLRPGTRELLAALPAERWAVVTSATRRLAEARLDAVGILPKTLVAADDVT